MDLDDEELKATRKLNGADRESNIEEDIKILEKDLFYYNEIKENFDEGTVKFYEALKHILAEREADKKRIKELEEALLKVKDKNIKLFINSKNSIPKQKVKEILDRLHITDIEPWSFYKVSGDILFDLKELLEDK